MSGKRINITVGMKGTVLATAPFDTLINPRQIYQCIGVETIDGLIAKGQEPYADVYEPNGIDEDQFNLDSDAGVRIITFQGGTGQLVSIPELYIDSLPDANGVPYRCVMLGISLSAIPNEMDITDLKTELGDLIYNYLGVRSTIKELAYGDPAIFSIAEHDAIEAARQNNITNNVSSRLRVTQLQTMLQDMTLKVQALEQYIKDNLPPP